MTKQHYSTSDKENSNHGWIRWLIMLIVTVLIALGYWYNSCRVTKQQPIEQTKHKIRVDNELAIKILLPDLMRIADCLCDVRKQNDFRLWPCNSFIGQDNALKAGQNISDRNKSTKVLSFYSELNNANQRYKKLSSVPGKQLSQLHRDNCDILKELWQTPETRYDMATIDPQQHYSDILKCRDELEK